MGNRVDFTVPGNATVSTTLHVSDSLFVDNIEIDPTGALQDQTFTFNGTKFVPTYTYNPSSEPMGFQNTTTDSTISFTNSTRTFTISPTGASFIVWCVGTKYIKTTTETVVIPDTTDQYLIYYSNTGVLSVKTTPYQLQYDAPVASVYWNQSASAAQYLSEERHGIVMDWRTHEYLHLTRGAAISSGLSAANYTTSGGATYGNSNADAQIDILHGIFYDEDLRIEISHAASPVPNTFQQRLSGGAYLPVFYKTNSGFCTKDVATQYPLKQGTARPKYNLLQSGSWSTPDLGQNKYGISWIAATNMLSEPVVVILGQTEYANIGDAQSAVVSSLDMTGFTVAEFVFLYKVIYQVSNAYSNTPHARIAGVYDIRSSGDTAGGTSVSTADHGGLTGLLDDDHPQYALIDGARSFTGTLGLRAGSASASTAPIKFNASSVLMTTPEAHSVEWDGTNIYATTVAGTRKTVAYIDNFGSTNVLSADKWSTARTVTFATGAVTGSFSIDGSANVSDVVLNVGTTSTPTLSQLVLYGNLTLDGASATSGSPRTIGFNLGGSGFSRLSLESSGGAQPGGAQLGTGQRLQLYSYHGIEIRGARGISGAPAYQPFVLAGVADTALTVYSASATNLPVAIRGATSQTADLQQWQNSAGTSLASISNTGTFSVPNITITNPGVGATSKLTFTKTSDTAFIDVTESSADQTLWSHTMGDNPDGGDYFRWYMFDYQGYGGDWEPLSFGALSANIRANNINMYGDVVINSGGWHSGGVGTGYARLSGNPGAVSTITKAGTITPTFNSVGYTGTNSTVYWVKIDTGASTFSWNVGSQSAPAAASALPLSTSPTTLSQGVTVTWSATTGASAGDQWQIRVYKSAKLIVRAATGQTTNLQEWQNSSSTKMAFVDASGGFYGIALGSPNQTGSYLTLANTNPITLNTGGASVIGFVVKGAASQIADLQQWNDNANAIQSNIRSDGTFETVAGLRFYTNTSRSAFSTLSNTSGNLSFNYQFALTDRLTVTAGASATVPVTVKAFSATQTANLQEWQSSAGTALTYITSTGTVAIGGQPVNQSFGLTLRDKIIGSQQTLINSGLQVHFAMARGNSNGPWMSIGTVDDGSNGIARTVIVNTSNVELFSVSQTGTIIGTTSSSVNPGLILRGASGQTADLQQWQTSAASVQSNIRADGTFETVAGLRFYTSGARSAWSTLSNTNGSLSFNYPFTLTDRLAVTAGANTTVPVTIKAFSPAQSANLQQWQTSAASVVAYVDADGTIGTSGSIVARGGSTFWDASYTSSGAGVGTVPTTRDWKTIVSVSAPGGSALYTGAEYEVDVLFKADNYANASSVVPVPFQQMTFGVTMIRAGGQPDDTNWGAVWGPVAEYVRLVRVDDPVVSQAASSACTWEIQVRQPNDFQSVKWRARRLVQYATTQTWSTATSFDSLPLGASAGYQVFVANNAYKYQHRFSAIDAKVILAQPWVTGETPLIVRGVSGQTADLQQWQNSSNTVLTKIGSDGSLTVGGNLTVNGTTVTVNSTTVTIDDPIFTLGGDTPPANDDNKDRGIEFRWHNGSAAKLGFFGFDDSTGKFTFIPDTVNASEVFSGTTGEIDAKFSWPNVLSPPTITLYGAVSGTIILTNASTASASITMAPNGVVLGTDTSGAYVGNVISGEANGITAASAAGVGGENNQITLFLPQALHASAAPTFSRVISTQADTGFFGTPPFQVTSTGLVGNLNANYLGGKTAASFVLQSEYTDAELQTKIRRIDGANSGFDAEFLGGNAASTYLSAATYTGQDILNKLVNIPTQPLTGLNADLLDSRDSTYFAAQASLEAVLGDLLYVGLYNATNYTVTNRSASSSVVTITSASAHGLAAGNIVGVRLGKKTATFVSRTGTAASLNTDGPPGLITGQKIVVDGIADTSFNGTWTVSGTAASAVYFNTSASTTVASASVSGYVAPASFWGQTFTVTAVPTPTTFQYAFTETVNIASAASDGKIFRMPTPVWSGAVGASATASSTYRHGMYWIVSDNGLSDFVDADLSGKQTWNEADSNLIKGDWVIAINPTNNPAQPQTNLSISAITFQMLPFSEETFVKGKITDHANDVNDPHGPAGYLLRDASAVLGTPIRLASVSRNGTVATVVTSVNHGFTAGKNIVITSVGASYDGNYVVSTASSVTPTVFTYLTSAASAASTNASSGFVAERDANRVADFVFSKLNHNHNTEIQNAINVHSAAADPHPIYVTPDDGKVLFADKEHNHNALYEVINAVSAHETTFNHTQFLTSGVANNLYFPANGTFDDRYYVKDLVDAKIAGIKNEISPTDGAQSSRIYVGASAPAAGNLLRGDIWIQTESLDLLSPVAPIGLTVSATSPTTTTLGWGAWPSTSLVTSLTLIRAQDASFTSPTTLTAASTSVTFNDTGLSENTTYYYRLNANNGANPSVGATASVSTTTLNAAPPAVTGVTAASVSGNSNILMTWTGASAGDLPTNKYRIYLGTNFVATASASPYTFTGLSEGTLYTVGVQTIDNGGLTSTTVSASTTTANLVPTTVGTVTGASSSNQITFSWPALSPAIPDFATYRVYLAQAANPGNELSAPSETTNQSITFGGLSYATTYTARVYAVDKSGIRSAAPSISTVTIGAVPDATPPVAATITSWQPEASYGAMKLIGNWSSSADFNFGQIEVSTDGANWTSVFSASATVSGSINIGCGTFAAGQTVYARINVRDSNGNWGYGAAVTYTLITSPTLVTADSTNSWRNTSGGQYNSQGNSRPYQGYATNSAWNAIGLWYYGTKPSDIYNNGRRKFVDGSLFVIQRADAGSSAAMTPILAMHDGTASPGTISNVGAPALFSTGQSSGVSVTTPNGGSSGAYAPLLTSWVEALVNGSHRGIAVYAATSPVYANFLSITESGSSGLLILAHLG